MITIRVWLSGNILNTVHVLFRIGQTDWQWQRLRHTGHTSHQNLSEDLQGHVTEGLCSFAAETSDYRTQQRPQSNRLTFDPLGGSSELKWHPPGNGIIILDPFLWFSRVQIKCRRWWCALQMCIQIIHSLGSTWYINTEHTRRGPIWRDI